MSRVVVIGGGIAGLATAALVAKRGHEVELLEKNAEVGGRIAWWEQDGFRFDLGPTWYLMPEVFDRYFELLDSCVEDELTLEVLDPGYRVFYEGEPEPLEIRPDLEANIKTFEAIEPGAGEALRKYVASASRTYDMAMKHFLYTDFSALHKLVKADVVRGVPALVPLLLRSLQSKINGSFSDQRLQQVLGHPAVFLGTSPERTPSMYHLMSSLDMADAVRFPAGGFRSLIDALENSCIRQGVRVRTGVTVTKIVTAPGSDSSLRANAVEFVDENGQAHRLDADIVISAADMHHTETALLAADDADHKPAYWAKADPGPGTVLACLGVRGQLPELPHHSLFFTRDWRENFDAIYGKDPRVPSPASSYVCRPTATEPSFAPEGYESIFVLVPVPALTSIGAGGLDGQGDPGVEEIVDEAIDQIASWAGIPDLRERIVLRRTIGPRDFETDYNAWEGGALGPAHTLRQSAMFRARNYSRKVPNLIYSGSSTIPGIGMPMCLISAELAADRVEALVAKA